MGVLVVILVLLVLALFFNLILSKFKVPPIIGYIFTGVIVGNLFHIEKEILELIAELGIVFLMFTIGLEFSPEKLKSMKKEVFLFGSLEMLVVGAVFGLIFYFIFNINIQISMILGLTIALSSTAIVLKLLNESRDIAKPYGRSSLGILLFQDIAVIPILIAISIIVNKNASVSQLILNTIIAFIALGAFIVIFGRYIAPFILTQAVKTKSDEIFMLSILFVVFLAAGVAHFFNLSYSLGAFLAGMVISETKFKYQIEADLMPFRDLLLGVFFVSVGLMVDIHFIINNFFSIIVFTIVFIILKMGVLYFLFKFLAKTNRIAIKIAVVLAQIGEFAFVIFALLNKYNLVDSVLLQKLVIITVVSMIATPFIIRYIDKIADLFDEKVDSSELLNFKPAEVSNHIIVIGYDKIGQRVVKKIKERNLNYIAIDKQVELVKEGIKRGDNVVFGNAANKKILHNFNIEEASAIIITTLNEEHTHMIIESVLELNKDLNVVILTENEDIEVEFSEYNLPNIHIIDKIKTLSEKIVEFAVICEIGVKK